MIIDGDSGNRIHNFSLGDGLFMGQGTKDSGTNRLGLSDADGLLQNSSITPVGQHLLVVRVDFSGGNEDAWLWIDPALDSEPSTGSADASSNNVKEFSFDFVQMQLQRPNNTGLDEIRLGSTFAEVSPSAGPPNSPPTVSSPGNQTSAENEAISLQISAADPDGQALIHSASGLPPSLSIDSGTGLITGPLGFDAAGSHAVTVTVSDGSLTADASFTWTVLAPPSVPAVGSLGLVLLALGFAATAIGVGKLR